MSRLFGQKLKQLRQARGLTLAALADLVGSRKAYIWQLENKPKATPTAVLTFALADALCADARYLIDDNQPIVSKEED